MNLYFIPASKATPQRLSAQLAPAGGHVPPPQWFPVCPAHPDRAGQTPRQGQLPGAVRVTVRSTNPGVRRHHGLVRHVAPAAGQWPSVGPADAARAVPVPIELVAERPVRQQLRGHRSAVHVPVVVSGNRYAAVCAGTTAVVSAVEVRPQSGHDVGGAGGHGFGAHSVLCDLLWPAGSVVYDLHGVSWNERRY